MQNFLELWGPPLAQGLAIVSTGVATILVMRARKAIGLPMVGDSSPKEKKEKTSCGDCTVHDDNNHRIELLEQIVVRQSAESERYEKAHTEIFGRLESLDNDIKSILRYFAFNSPQSIPQPVVEHPAPVAEVKKEYCILVVDDQQEITSSVSSFLELHGFACIQANTRSSAVAHIRGQYFNGFIVDAHIDNPGDGVDLIDEILQTYDANYHPIILISGTSSFRTAPLPPGVMFLEKPISMQEVVKLLNRGIQNGE